MAAVRVCGWLAVAASHTAVGPAQSGVLVLNFCTPRNNARPVKQDLLQALQCSLLMCGIGSLPLIAAATLGTLAQAMRRCHALRARVLPRCGELVFDFATAALSMADIVADVAVTVEFYQAGRFTFFTISLGIFALAQACYAFLFAATYGGHLSNCKKTIVFLFALPFAQLVPVFALVESFHLSHVSDMLRGAGLRPTSMEEARPADSGADSLWQLLQRKYHAHAGFLVEALVEAIPQCALQIAAVVLARESSALNVFSILLSLAVIASKGWLAAYSIHRPTFLFNSICIAADVAGCFATAAWLAVWLLDTSSPLAPLPLDGLAAIATIGLLSNTTIPTDIDMLSNITMPAMPLPNGTIGIPTTAINSTAAALVDALNNSNASIAVAPMGLIAPEWTTPCAHAAAGFALFFIHLVIVGVVCGVVGGGGTILFSMADDHLKTRDPAEHTGIEVDSVAFNVYVLRGAAWLLSILPCITLLMLLRLSLLPLVAFQSLSSEHATHHAFYTALFAFLGEAPRDDDKHGPAADSPGAAPAAAATTSARAPVEPPPPPPPPSTAVTTSSSTSAITPVTRPPRAAATLDERLATVNALINLAHAGADDLRCQLASLGAHPSKAAINGQVRQWVAALGRRRPPQPFLTLPRPSVAPEAAASPPSRVPDVSTPARGAMVVMWWERPAPEPPSVEAMGRWARRYALCLHSMRRRRRNAAAGLAKRSAVFRIITSGGFAKSGYRSGVAEKALFMLALFGLTLVLIAALPATLVVLLIIPCGALFPIIQLGLSIAAAAQAADVAAKMADRARSLAAFDAALVLPWTLSGCFLVCVLLLLLLLPRVHRFQAMRADIAPTSGLPAQFFCPEVVHEMAKRFNASRDPRLQSAPYDAECCICIKYIERRSAAVLDPCGHAFHHQCIHTWLRGGRSTCPLCRAHASVNDIVSHPLGEEPTVLEICEEVSP